MFNEVVDFPKYNSVSISKLGNQRNIQPDKKL